MNADKCAVCQRDPARMNSDFAECSHVDCPHRRKAWSDGIRPRWRKPERKPVDPCDAMFDNPNKTKEK